MENKWSYPRSSVFIGGQYWFFSSLLRMAGWGQGTALPYNGLIGADKRT